MTMKDWSELGLILIKTEDGSPSLRLPLPVRPEFSDGESMHHSGGALEETLYIYGPVFDFISEKVKSSHLVVGLGLGYIEMLIAIKSMLRGISEVRIVSFESEEGLRQGFLRYLADDLPEGEILATYNEILTKMLVSLEASSISIEQVKSFLGDRLEVRGALDISTLPQEKYHGIYFDAFSKKTSPDLWTEVFLKDFFTQVTDSDLTAVGTYACTGVLKRCLKSLNFQLEAKLGFKAKRDATFATRRRDPF